ncbi:MAG: HD domain-containing protein [Nitriliruptor sp.]|uniref:HD domain-containing protein n=1 Tax=Nitriliruptor sp. TaxID=2448056 RepID=UPI0034A048C4
MSLGTSPPDRPGGGLRHRTRAVREAEEREWLSPAATCAADTRGRDHDEPDDEHRTAFERDRDRILHSKAFRRLKHKTQVFLNPEGDHFVTRLTHTLAVAQVGRAIASSLALNEALTEAICLGHDIGHAPFGHTGEDALTPYVEGEWQHAIHGVRVVELLEPLNLTVETRDGISQSSWKNDPPPITAEGWVCRYADRIAYLSHDVQDAVRAGVITPTDVPARFRDAFGPPGPDWIDSMVRQVIGDSLAAGHVTMDPDTFVVMDQLRDWMFERVYLRDEARAHATRAVRVIQDLVEWFADHPESIPDAYRLPDSTDLQAAVDHVAGMSDRHALRLHDERFRPAGLY